MRCSGCSGLCGQLHHSACGKRTVDANYVVFDDCSEKPIPDGYTNQWDRAIWNVGHVFLWSEVYSVWLDCNVRLTVKPDTTLEQAYEDRMGEPMWSDYAVFFVNEG